jgi:hypothetical protein
MAGIASAPSCCFFSGTATEDQLVWGVTTPNQGPDTSLNTNESLAPVDQNLSAAKVAAIDESAWASGTPVKAVTQDDDFNHRIWIIPNAFNLVNPSLGVGIPFKIWNTFDADEALTALTVTGSSVLTFDINVGNSLYAFQYKDVNMFIGEGEATVDATVDFAFTDGNGYLIVKAAVSDTFNLIPDVPVKETWEYLTDIITARDGSEQRISLRPQPRVQQDFEVAIITMKQRREQGRLLAKNIRVQSVVPLYQYGTNLTGSTSLGNTTIHCDARKSQLRAGQYAIIVNPVTEEVVISKISSIAADSIVLVSPTNFDVDPTWIICPAITSTVQDASALNMHTVTGTLRIKAHSYIEPDVFSTLNSATINTLDGLPILERRPLAGVPEEYSFRRMTFDNESGKREIKSLDTHARVSGAKDFKIDRLNDVADQDYWRKFIDTIKGAQKPFLLSTYFPDLTLSAALTGGDSTIYVNETDYPNLYGAHETWKHLAVEYLADFSPTTYHTVTSTGVNAGGQTFISFTPPLPVGVANANIDKICYLMKVRSEDSIDFSHYETETIVSLSTKTVDQ